MQAYSPPLQAMRLAAEVAAGSGDDAAQFEPAELVEGILDEASRLACEVIAPLNAVGDVNEPTLNADGSVITAPGWKEAYRAQCAGGWLGIGASGEHGGMGLSQLLVSCVGEIWHGANMSFALCSLLSQGLIEALEMAGSDSQKRLILPHLISGDWSGTMNLTEPQAGTNLAAIRTKAVRAGSQYRISGEKIFITYGAHDLSQNIIHLVLARVEGAPEGVKGISAFLVPSRCFDEAGVITHDNDVRCTRLENKLGIRGSPTAALTYGERGGAVGYLLGEENRGLEYMFVMMNRARFDVGLQGLAISERAYQQAREYARQRVQGTPLPRRVKSGGGEVAGGGATGTGTIIEHPDVKRMLIETKAITAAARAFSCEVAATMERAAGGNARAEVRKQLLIPIFKGWVTEMSLRCVSQSLQVHGGAGFVEEVGAAQHYRDARILPIYEGTTGVQGLDLVFRKIRRDDGSALMQLLAEIVGDGDSMRGLLASGEGSAVMRRLGLEPYNPQATTELIALIDDTAAGCARLGSCASNAIIGNEVERDVAALASDYLLAIGGICGGWQMIKMAGSILGGRVRGSYEEDFLRGQILLAARYGAQVLPLAMAHMAASERALGLDTFPENLL